MAAHWKWLALGTLLGFLAVAAASGLLALAGWFIIALRRAPFRP
jgi:ABC-type transport system involved in cytochrome bd biosynthesis fused ATPase/permease subunit